MKNYIRHSRVSFRKVIMVMSAISLVFACSKNSDTPEDLKTHYCTNIDWSETIGLSGSFVGAITNGQYNLVSVKTTDDGTDTFHAFHRKNNSNVILNDQPGWTFTYDAEKLVKLVVGEANGNITYSFDTNGHLTKTDIESTDGKGTTSLIFTYTYDVNDDPIKIAAHGISTNSSGTSTADYDITADYLTNKENFLPLNPEVTPFSVYYAYGFYLSKHLINKWVIKIDGTTEDGGVLPTMNFTQQYTYTYDSNGNVATMVHTGNSKNIFTFTYSGCS